MTVPDSNAVNPGALLSLEAASVKYVALKYATIHVREH